jgi:hypothetical protein
MFSSRVNRANSLPKRNFHCGFSFSSWPHTPAFRLPPQKAGAARLLEKADADAGDSAIRTTEGSNDYGVDFIA